MTYDALLVTLHRVVHLFLSGPVCHNGLIVLVLIQNQTSMPFSFEISF